jgi:hypothetical protein
MASDSAGAVDLFQGYDVVTGRTRQIVWLGALALVLVFAVLQWRAPSPAGGSGASSNTSGRAPDQPGTNVAVAEVKLAALEGERPPVPEARRNPFQFQQSAARAPDVVNVPRVEEFAPPAVPVGPPPLPPIPLRFIGVLEGAPTGRVGMFADARSPGLGTVFHGKEGEVIEGRYRVLRLGPESAELAYLDGRGRQTFRLSGQ